MKKITSFASLHLCSFFCSLFVGGTTLSLIQTAVIILFRGNDKANDKRDEPTRGFNRPRVEPRESSDDAFCSNRKRT